MANALPVSLKTDIPTEYAMSGSCMTSCIVVWSGGRYAIDEYHLPHWWAIHGYVISSLLNYRLPMTQLSECGHDGSSAHITKQNLFLYRRSLDTFYLIMTSYHQSNTKNNI